MRIWLDDIRPMPADFDFHAKTIFEAMGEIIDGDKIVTFVSFDHDLGEDTPSGYDLAKIIEEGAYWGYVERLDWQVHSDNSVGRENIRMAMESAERFWDKREKENGD